MSAKALRNLVTSAVARWRAFQPLADASMQDAQALAERRKLYTDQLLAACQVLLNSQWPWPRVESCLGKQLERHAGTEGFPPVDRFLAEVRAALKPKVLVAVVACRACEREGGTGYYLDSERGAIHDAVMGVSEECYDGAPEPLCLIHWERWNYNRWEAAYHAGVIQTMPLKPATCQTKADVLERIAAGKKQREAVA